MVIYLKRSLNALDLMAIVRELNTLSKTAYINNIYGISENIFLFKFGGVKCSLVYEFGRRINITGFDFEKPKIPSQFCSFLRSKLLRSKVLNVSQMGFDRIVNFQLDNGLSIIFEIMDNGNLLILDSNGVIIGVQKPIKTSIRRLFPGESYIPPRIRGFNPFKVDFEELYKTFKESKGSLVVSLTKIMNVSGEIAEELCFRCGLNKNLKVSELKREELEALLNTLLDMASSIESGSINPQIVSSSGRIVSVVPLDFGIYSNLEAEFFNDFNSAVDEYFHRLMNLEFEELKAKVRSEVEGRFKATISKQNELIGEMLNKAEKLRFFGKTLMENLDFFDGILRIFRDLASKVGWSNVLAEVEKYDLELSKYIYGFDVKNRILNIDFKGEILPLNVLESAASNASKFFDEAKNLEAKASRALKALKSLEENMELEVEKEFSKRIVKPIRIVGLVKRKWYENFHWFKSSDGFLVVGGRDASQNEALVRKWLRDDGIYVHADVHGGPSVIIISDSNPIPESTIYEAAQFASSFSNAWRAMLESTSAFWVYGRQVSKSPPSGEYLARGAFMIYGKKNYINNIPLRVSLGIMSLDNSYILVSGPPSAISKWCFKSLTLAPGEKSLDDIFNQLKRFLSDGLNESQKAFVKDLSINDFRRLLPRGGFRFIFQ
ncbi:MAG: ribosome rescue protein RqcH [Candidatus Methanomethylicia archaeon]